jgi:hypothetical protein
MGLLQAFGYGSKLAEVAAPGDSRVRRDKCTFRDT